MSRSLKIIITLCLLSGILTVLLLIWGLPGPRAGNIANPRPAQGRVVLTGFDGSGVARRCSVQAAFEVKGSRYTSAQLPYSKDLCGYRLNQIVPVAYNSLKPAESAALLRVSDHPLWPALLSAGLFIFSGLALLGILLRLRSRPGRAPSVDSSAQPKQPALPAESTPPKTPVSSAESAPPKTSAPPVEGPPHKEPASGSGEASEVIVPRSGITPPGWYPRRGRLCWWNGTRWTDNWQSG